MTKKKTQVKKLFVLIKYIHVQGGDFKLLSSYIHDIFYFTFQIT